jgi:glycosyltransferase involved in cell wall biosynthesis
MSKNNLTVVNLNKPGITDFASARNAILKSLKTDWVFFVDSDEELSKNLKYEAQEAIKTTKYNGFYIKRKNYFLGQYIGTDKIIRLGRKDAGGWKRKVHEVWDINGKIGELENPLIHNTAESLKDYITKINRYAKLHAEANKDEGKKSSLLKIIAYPKFKFIQSMLTGRGTVFSILQAFHSFLSWSELWLIQKH